MHCIVITSPIRKPLAYEFDTRADAESMVKVIQIAAIEGDLEPMGIQAGTGVLCEIVPASELHQHYDA